MHCHFSAIEFTSQGEKQHHTLEEKRFGPDFRMLAEVIADFQMHPTMICESPILDIDARKMKETLKQVLESRQQKAGLSSPSR
jgi:deoxyribonuclease-4